MMQKEKRGRAFRRIRQYTMISILVFVTSLVMLLILQQNYNKKPYSEKDVERFEKVLHAKERLVLEEFGSLDREFETRDTMALLNERSGDYWRLSEDEGIFIFYFEDGEIIYWSSNSVPIGSIWRNRYNQPFLEFRNASYVSVMYPTEHGILYAMILIRTSYPYENEYLTNGYQKDFGISADIAITNQHEDGLYKISNSNGEFLFSLDLSNSPRRNRGNINLALACFLVAILSLFSSLFWYIYSRETRSSRTLSLGAGILILALVFLSIFEFRFPGVIFLSRLFQPDVFANLTFSSLGNLWAFVLFVLLVVILFYRFFDRSNQFPGRLQRSISIFLLLLASFWFVLLNHILAVLVLDSNISFEAYKLNSLDLFTFIGMLILVLGFISLCLLIDKALTYREYPSRLYQIGAVLISVVLVQLPFIFLDSFKIELSSLLFYLLFVTSVIYIRQTGKIRFSTFVFPVIFFALFSTLELQKHASEKTQNQKEIELVKLSSERDVVAEMLFSELSETLKNDSLLMRRLSVKRLNIDLIYEYLQRNYFSGYWTKYDLQITLCGPDDSVFVEPPVENWFHCYNFFDDIVIYEGLEISGSDFYFLNNLNARISYLGRIPYFVNGMELTLFLELDSKIISEELGYPELLLRRESTEKIPYSYARYNMGQLITSGGEFEYRLTPNSYTEKKSTFENKRVNGYDHSILNVDADGDNTVIVSTPSVTLGDKLISFTYIFGFYFLLLTVGFLVVLAPRLRTTILWDFKNKIQYSMIGILFLTFVFICAGTIYFIVEQYQTKHHNNLQNTMRSVYIELVHKVEYEEDLRNWSSESYYNLDELLRKFSNVFYTDINMFDEQGFLLASSRSEIFDQQLLSTFMNRDAFEKLAMEDYSAYIHTEHIGKLSYQSAYVPLLNSENRFLAYLNLPYFTQPKVLAQEVTNLVVAVLNVYVILLLVILFLSVFLADRITQPLRVIQNRIAQLSLSKKNEKIVYRGKDEIRGLVEEYNFMVDELTRSAELLAQSERETAWREMAKQIAHEIKNPLTPMKLNVQHLMRMVAEGDKNIEDQIGRMSQTLIEQIDSLSSIANEFSDFAKMPKAKNQKIDLITKLKNTVQLFQNNDKAEVSLDIRNIKKLTVFGDPEQVQRLIINLVKNAIQSIPDKRKGIIKISAEITDDGNALIKVEDNGKGIPDSIQDKLFQPNFTTKGSGMGMGLAIAANIVTSMNGKIWYKTKLDKGTVFFIIFPLQE